jgi:hypothetical protein
VKQMMQEYAFLLPVAALLVIVGVWELCKQVQEPLSQRESYILGYVKQNDGINAVILGHAQYSSGGTAWAVQPIGDKYESFTVVDNGYFRTNIVSDDYKQLSSRP